MLLRVIGELAECTPPDTHAVVAHMFVFCTVNNVHGNVQRESCLPRILRPLPVKPCCRRSMIRASGW